MSKKTSPNELYWQQKVKRQIRDEYQAFLQEEDRESSPENAAIFAARVLKGSAHYHGYSERELIILLAGKLPYMWD